MVQRVFVPGGIANELGDLYGTSPLRIIPHGKVVIEAARAGVAIMMGWKAAQKSGADCDDDFAWLHRSPEDRESRRRGLVAGGPALRGERLDPDLAE